MKGYLYRPYHGWRHGYRRETRRKWLFGLVKILLVAEMVILSRRYLAEHTSHTVYEREVLEDETGEQRDVVGVGFDRERGEWIWFHQYEEDEG